MGDSLNLGLFVGLNKVFNENIELLLRLKINSNFTILCLFNSVFCRHFLSGSQESEFIWLEIDLMPKGCNILVLSWNRWLLLNLLLFKILFLLAPGSQRHKWFFEFGNGRNFRWLKLLFSSLLRNFLLLEDQLLD